MNTENLLLKFVSTSWNNDKQRINKRISTGGYKMTFTEDQLRFLQKALENLEVEDLIGYNPKNQKDADILKMISFFNNIKPGDRLLKK